MGVGSVRDGMRLCRSAGHLIPADGRECRICKKARDDRHRENARLAGRDADRQRTWYRAKYWSDHAFREAERKRFLERHRRPESILARRLGIGVDAARDLVNLRDQ